MNKFSSLSILKILLILSVLFAELSLPVRASISIEKICPFGEIAGETSAFLKKPICYCSKYGCKLDNKDSVTYKYSVKPQAHLVELL
jgi:hypothetical protein